MIHGLNSTFSHNPSARLYSERYGALTPAITLATVKSFIRQDESVDAEEDLLLDIIIKAACDWAENYCGIPVISSGTKSFLDLPRRKGTSNLANYFYEPGTDTERGQKVFDLVSALEINSVKLRYEDGTFLVIPAEEYSLTPEGQIEFVSAPLSYKEKPLAAVQSLIVDFNAGLAADLATVPPLMQMGLLQLCEYWYEHRDQVGVIPAGTGDNFVHFKHYEL